MKNLKVIICTILLITSMSRDIYASSEQLYVTIPSFDITVNGSRIESTNMQYPLIVYEDITYFPLTWNWCTEMGLASGYTAMDGLYIANYPSYEPIVIDEFDEGGYQKVGSRYLASIPMYPVFINGVQIDNENERYPLLNFRGITYFPLTWRFVVEEFGWDMSWNDETGFHISSNGRATELPPGSEYENINFYTEESYQDFSVVRKSVERRAIDAIPNEGGGNTNRMVSKSFERYKLEYNTNELLPIDTDDVVMVPHNNGSVVGERIDDLIEVEGNRINYRDNLLLDLSDTIREGETIDGLFATNYQLNGMNVVTMKVFFKSNGQSIPAPYTPQSHYVLVDYGTDILQKVADWPISQVPTLIFPYGEEGVYLCSEYSVYSGTRFSNGRGHLVLLQSDETATLMNDLWVDWNSVRPLGMDENGILYLLNTWCPDENPFWGNGKVSPVRDGYFSLNTDGELTKIFPFIQSDKTVVTQTGEIYLDIGRKESILHLQSGTWIQP